MKILGRYRLNKVLDAYVKLLSPALKRRYGASDQYTALQISKTLRALKLNDRYVAYAIALFRHEESKNTIGLFNIDQAFLNKLRGELGVRYFEGRSSFDANDVLALTVSRGWKGGSAPNWQENRYGRSSL